MPSGTMYWLSNKSMSKSSAPIYLTLAVMLLFISLMLMFEFCCKYRIFIRIAQEDPLSSSLAHLLEKLFLPFSQVGRELHVVRENQISPCAVRMHVALSLQPHFRAGLCSRFDV